MTRPTSLSHALQRSWRLVAILDATRADHSRHALPTGWSRSRAVAEGESLCRHIERRCDLPLGSLDYRIEAA